MSPKQLFALLVLNLLTVSLFSQQLTITDTYTEQQLVEDYLVQGCVEISNIESNVNGEVNDIKSFGYFEKASSNFPFQNGIILSTGRAVSGANGTNAAVLNEGQNTWRTDPDLENALGISGTVNATSIEFDFISIANQISFNYILASEEYFGNFPCEYSDGFALLIRPADGSEPYQNIALIPGTNIPVNTKTIHDEIVGFCEAENEEYFEGYNLGDTNFNGRTAVMTASASIVPNVKYHIKLVIADQSDKNYDSAVFIEGNSFNATVELGDDITTCAEVETIYADIGNPEATYSWYKNGSRIQGETGTELTVENSGNYSVKVVLPFLDGTCTIEDSIVINLSSTQTAEALSDFEICDDLSGNGKEIFDLSLKTDEVLESVPDSEYEVSYHYSLVDAELGQNAIDQPIENSTNPQTIYVRIRDIENGCLAYSDFKLVVNELPNLNPVYDYFACDDLTADGTVSIDLDSYNNLLTNGNEDLMVSYHNNLTDARSGNNPLEIPYTNSVRSETLYAYVLNELTGCSSTTEIYLEVKDNPVINDAPVYIDACDQQHDGFSTFDLTSVIDEITNGQTGVEISFHTTRADADLGINPILQPEAYQNEVSEKQRIFIRVEDSETGCATVRKFEIHSNLLLTATNIRDFSLCEVGDGANAFDLVKIAEIIMNNLEGVEILFYESPSDRANSQNAINTNVDYIPQEFPSRIYITLQTDQCSEIAEFDLILNPSFNFGDTNTLDYCIAEDEELDTIDLSALDSIVLNGQNGYIVTYYENLDDAENQRNALPNDYQGWSVPQSIFARIQVPDSDCFDIVPFELNVESSPTIEQPSNIAICDYNGQGTATINLEEKISEIVDNPTDFIIQFFESLESAEANTDAISNISEYETSSKEVFVRVDKPDGGCPALTSFNIYINNTPQIQQISEFEHCEYNTDYVGDFIFSEKDQEITQGNNGLEVLYFLNSQDAEDGSNPIDKESVYNNTSNPQTIYYRVQHKTDSSCYNTSSFQIVVGTSPEYNKPTDLFLCDDISNDQREMFDLSIALNEIK
ncbi:MAG: choice-of-anchor L domain-containing protein, partial [Flavobacteriaceae bacterium]|nr:choice-of-anchor L domain-containing protein [Flavobacteriaceae bacterium]